MCETQKNYLYTTSTKLLKYQEFGIFLESLCSTQKSYSKGTFKTKTRTLYNTMLNDKN